MDIGSYIDATWRPSLETFKYINNVLGISNKFSKYHLSDFICRNQINENIEINWESAFIRFIKKLSDDSRLNSGGLKDPINTNIIFGKSSIGAIPMHSNWYPDEDIIRWILGSEGVDTRFIEEGLKAYKKYWCNYPYEIRSNWDDTFKKFIINRWVKYQYQNSKGNYFDQ